MTDLPADWAIEKALRECEDSSGESAFPFSPVCTVQQIKDPGNRIVGRKLILAHARLIEQTQPAPVDRKLLVAREAVAKMLELEGSNTLAAMVRAGGEYDEKPGVLCCLKFHELWESGYAA